MSIAGDVHALHQFDQLLVEDRHGDASGGLDAGKDLARGQRVQPREGNVDLSRFCSGLLRAMLSSKETGYGSDTQRRVQA